MARRRSEPPHALRRFAAACCGLLLAFGLLVGDASAQVLEPPELTLRPSREAGMVEESRRLHEEAWSLHGRMLFEQALAKLREAYHAYRDPRLLLGMGRAAQMIPGQGIDAIQYYEACGDALERIERRLTEQSPGASADRRREIEEDLARVAEYRENVREGVDEVRPWVETEWARVPIDLSPADAVLTFSGRSYPPMVANQASRWVPLGNHLVEVTARGHAIHREWITAGPGMEPLRVKLQPAPELRTGDIRVRCGVPGCRVTIRGEDATSALQSPYLVAPGTYDVVVTAPGLGDMVRTVTVDSGQSVPIVIGPPPGLASVVPVALPPRRSELPGVTTTVGEDGTVEWTRADTGWTLIGAGGALLITAAVMHGVAWDRAASATDRDIGCPGCYDAARADYDSAKAVYTGAIVGYSVGAASAAAGVLLLVLDPDEDTPVLGGAPIEGGGMIEGRLRF